MTTYRHLVGGEAYGVSHQPGDIVSSKVPRRKLAEWLAAGVIEEITDESESDTE